MQNDICFYCSKPGHWARNCPSKTPEKSSSLALPPPQQPATTPHFSQSSKTQNYICFHCSKPGHWARDCPSKTPEKSPPSSSRGGPTSSSEYPSIDCPCGNGPCPILVSRSEKNPGRSFYRCPVQGSGKCTFFKWCDQIKKEDTKVTPKCPCGAGSCRELIEDKEPNVGRSYFVCPIKKGLGACPFFEWADNESYKDVSKGYSSPQSICDSHKVFDVPSNELQTEQRERMELIVSNPQDLPNSEAVPTSSAQAYVLLKENQDAGRTSRILPEKEHDPSLCLTPRNENTVPNSIKGDLVTQEVESWDSMVQKASVVPLMSQYDIHCRQIEFWKQISAAGGISTAGISPSYDPIFIYKDRNMLNPEGSTSLASQSFSDSDHDNLLSRIPGQDLQLWNGDVLKPTWSSLKRSSTRIEDDNIGSFVASLISKSLEETVLHIQNQLVMILNSIDPSNYNYMNEAARLFLPLLDGIPVNNNAFSGCVKEFIDSATKLSAIEQSICNEQSQGCSELYNREKVHFDDISKVHEKAVSDFTSANKHLLSLQDEASNLRDMLRKIEDKLLGCEAEISELKTRVDGINRDMLESKRRMQKAEEALKLYKQREEERCAARTALEKMRIQLQQYVGSKKEVCGLPSRKRLKL